MYPDLSHVLLTVGMCIGLLILAENMTRVIGYYLPGSILANRTNLILVGNFLVILPLSLARDVTLIGKIASLSVCGNLIITLAVLLQRSTPSPAANALSAVGPNLIGAIGIISFSFVCHHNTFLIRESLEVRSSRLFSVVTSISVGVSLLMSLLLAVPAYLHFGAQTDGKKKPNALTNP